MYLVIYDISDPRRLRKTGRFMQRYGRRVQKSVFECRLKRSAYRAMLYGLSAIAEENDSIMIYALPERIVEEKIMICCL